MPNLRGSDHFRQIRSALMKMERFGVSRHNTESRNIHSTATFNKREQILNEFSRYTQDNNLNGKLNTLMTNENISNFLNHKLENLQASTAENYCRSFSAMVDSLRDNNITVQVEQSVFNDKVSEVKSNDNSVVQMNRAVDNPHTVINNLFDKHYHSGVIAEVQLLGFRVSEAEELTINLDKYLDRDTNIISGVIGKGRHEYPSKEISQSLISKIEAIDKTISQSTYMNDLKEEGIKSHDFRYLFSKETYNEQIKQKSHYEALVFTSKEMNHHRAETTRGYLSKA